MALQKRHIVRFLLRRSVGSIAVLPLRPAQEDNPVVLGAKCSTTLQSGLLTGIVPLGIGNAALCFIGIVDQCVLLLLVVRGLITVVIDRVVHIKDLLIRVPDKIWAGLHGIQHIGFTGIIAIYLLRGQVGDLLTADFLSSHRIHRFRLSYSSLRIYPVVVDSVAVRRRRRPLKRAICHIDSCDQLPFVILSLKVPIIKINGNRI